MTGWTHLENVLQYVFLQNGVVNTHRATADFHAVENEVVVLSADLKGEINELRMRPRGARGRT